MNSYLMRTISHTGYGIQCKSGSDVLCFNLQMILQWGNKLTYVARHTCSIHGQIQYSWAVIIWKIIGPDQMIMLWGHNISLEDSDNMELTNHISNGFCETPKPVRYIILAIWITYNSKPSIHDSNIWYYTTQCSNLCRHLSRMMIISLRFIELYSDIHKKILIIVCSSNTLLLDGTNLYQMSVLIYIQLLENDRWFSEEADLKG